MLILFVRARNPLFNPFRSGRCGRDNFPSDFLARHSLKCFFLHTYTQQPLSLSLSLLSEGVNRFAIPFNFATLNINRALQWRKEGDDDCEHECQQLRANTRQRRKHFRQCHTRACDVRSPGSSPSYRPPRQTQILVRQVCHPGR